MFRERPTQLAILLISLLTIFRLWYCTYNDLAHDEAYYWLWAQHLDASYYSKGPAVAWTIALGTALFGDTVFGVRFFAVMLAAGTGWQLFLLTRRLFNPQAGLLALAAAAIMPLYSVGSVIMTIDPLSVFFWAWAANLFWDALEKDGLGRWALCGFAVGSGFLAKYTNALQLLSFLVFLLWSAAHRQQLRRPGFWCLLAVFALCTLPVVWWNAQHGWITATHVKEGGHLQGALRFEPKEFFQFWQGQFLVVSPALFLVVLAAVAEALRLGDKMPSGRYLLALFLPVFLLYAALSFNDAGNLNWTAPCYVAGFALAGNWLARHRAWLAAVVLGLGLLQTALAHETHWLNLRKDPLMRLRGWAELAQGLQPYVDRARPVAIIAEERGLASELAFYLAGNPRTFIPHQPGKENQFSFWPTYVVAPGEAALYVTNSENQSLPAGFSEAEKLTELPRQHRGRIAEHYTLWLLKK